MKLHKSIVILCAHYLIAQQLTAAPFAFVANNDANAGFTVTPINLATYTAGAPITVGAVGSGPLRVAITPNGLFAYVTNITGGNVAVINTITDDLVTNIPVGSSPSGIAITPNGEFAYVNNEASNTISVITVATNTVLTTIPIITGNAPVGIAITPDGTTAYAATFSVPGVAIINLASNTQTGFISLPGTGPQRIAITPNGEFAYVTDPAGTNVIPINLVTNTAETPIPLPTGSDPRDIAITPNGATAYVTDAGHNTVIPITIATNTAGTPIPLGALTFPEGIAITQDGTKAFIVQSTPGNVAIINIPANTLSTTTIAVGALPVGIAITPVISPSPSSFTGFIQQNKFLNVTECVLTMQWTASPTTDVVSYQIFRNGVLLVTVPATSPLTFTTGLSCCDTGAGFTLVAVDSNGIASIPVPLVLVPAPVV